GLGGKLGLAFGAQGNGGRNAAHFVPGVNEINITRTSGAGALAHEWGHALDHHFGVLAGLSRDSEPFASWLSSYRRAKPDNKIRPEVAEAFQLITQTMQSREESAAEGMARAEHRLAHTQQKLADILKQEDLVNRLAGNDTALVALEKIKAGDIGEYVALSP
ncbi:hypothetical protein ACUHMQ_21040, partial [Chitinimonas sp. PSY-7]|uniref:hypothetical protein n=1 Tax=Chitinimonas sp. PSY-7 TaxID=3459088 RepID=UPI00403FD100